jgi:MraZ protein
MQVFDGEYESTLDAKGRFLFPAGLKKQLQATEENRFMLTRGLDGCLYLYTMDVWRPMHEKLSGASDLNPKVREFRRFFLSGSMMVEFDSAGRLLLPPNLKEYAAMQKDIVLSSAGKKIEIWDKAKYDKMIGAMSIERFGALGTELNNEGLNLDI